MKKSSIDTENSAHQTVTEFIKLQTPTESIQIGFTDQKVSGRAGLLIFGALDYFGAGADQSKTSSETAWRGRFRRRVSFPLPTGTIFGGSNSAN